MSSCDCGVSNVLISFQNTEDHAAILDVYLPRSVSWHLIRALMASARIKSVVGIRHVARADLEEVPDQVS